MKGRFMFSVVVLMFYMGVIFWISSLPSEQLTPPESGAGITISASIKHVGEYAVLGILMSLVIAQVSNKTRSTILYSFLFSSCYGILDEVHQFFVPTRFCTFSDMYADVVGSVMGVLFYVAFSRYVRFSPGNH